MEKECTIRIGGAAGQGVQFIGTLLSKFFVASHFHVFTHQDYMSRIRGGHNFYQIRIASHEISASRQQVDILLALNLETIERHHKDLSTDGLIIYDPDIIKTELTGPEFDAISLKKIQQSFNLDSRTVNSMAVGAIVGTLGIKAERLSMVIQNLFPFSKEELVHDHTAAAKAGCELTQHKSLAAHKLPLESAFLKKSQHPQLLNGNQAIGIGAILSGCKFYAAYPMTPSTSIMVHIAAHAKQHNIIVEQAEDEIAAINMVLGASFAGVRAMTGTSGGGFALMTEGISLAGITETPIVIAEIQRPGPATGLPTRTEQSDLLFVLFSGHGEFPRVIFTPGSPEQAITLTNKAFHLAEKYQIPVLIQSDQYLADSGWTYSAIETEHLHYQDFRLREPELADVNSYKRYQYCSSGVSPLAVPGQSKHLVIVDSDEHDEEGHIIEDAQIRKKMVRKRYHQKIPQIRQEMAAPFFSGDKAPQILLIGYGSTYGVLKEAIAHLSQKNRIAMLHFSELFPLPMPAPFDYISLLKVTPLTICVENNASSQFARLLRMETGITFSALINKFDGRPFIIDSLIGEINDLIGKL